MAWEGTDGKRTVTTEVIIGMFVAVLVTIMAAIGGLNFWALTGGIERLQARRRSAAYQRNIRRHPELVLDLSRLNRRIHEVLYQCQSDHPSLALNGTEIAHELQNLRKPTDFRERLAVLQDTYRYIHRRVVQFCQSPKKSWRTSEYAWLVDEVSNHLNLVKHAFVPLYEESKSAHGLSADAYTRWHDFATEYNTVLAQWKEFVEKSQEADCGGSQTAAVGALDLPQP